MVKANTLHIVVDKVKNKAKKAVRNVRRRATRLQRSVPMRASQGTGPLEAFANLVAHPETAPVVHSTFPSPQGEIMRFSTTFVMAGGVADTAYALLYSPGTSYLITRSSTSSSAVGAFQEATIVLAGTVVPGSTYLAANSESFRAISSCVKVSYNGTELNRSGTIMAGQVTVGEQERIGGLAAVSPSVDTLAQLSSMESRTTDHCIVWKAGDLDQNYLQVADTGVLRLAAAAGRNAIMILGRGLTAGSGMRVKITTTYEYMPAAGVGIPVNSSGPAVPAPPSFIHTLLDKEKGTSWPLHVGEAALGAFSKEAGTIFKSVKKNAVGWLSKGLGAMLL